MIRKHPYRVKIRGKESIDVYANRVTLQGTVEIVLRGEDNHFVRLIGFPEDLESHKEFVARVIEYSSDDYSEVTVQPRKIVEEGS